MNDLIDQVIPLILYYYFIGQNFLFVFRIMNSPLIIFITLCFYFHLIFFNFIHLPQ